MVQKITSVQKIKHEELEEICRKMRREVEKLETEGKTLRKELKEIINKAKMKNVLQDIIKQPD